jgi:O-antigen/teichoic acid export membrane protein
MTTKDGLVSPASASSGLSRITALARDPSSWIIFGSAGSLVGTMAVTSLLGFVYWWVAARLFETRAVGFAAASLSAMNLLGSLSMLGFGTLLIGEIPRHRDREWAFVNTVLAVTGGAGFAFGLAFAGVAPMLARDLAPLRQGPGSMSFFAAGVAFTSATNILDLALIAMLRGSVQFWRNVIFAVSKLLFVVLLALAGSRSSATGLYATWTLGNIVSLLILAWPLLAERVPPISLKPELRLLRGLERSAAWHHVQNLALQMATLVLPLIVIATLSAAENAYFYIIWLLAGFVFVPPFAISIGLYTIGAREPNRFTRYVRLSIGVAVLFGLAAVVVTWLLAGPLLQIFGAAYREHGAAALRLAVVGVFPLIVKDHFVACCRVRNRVAAASIQLAAGSLFGLACAGAGAAIAGLNGVVIGWLLAEAAQTVLFLPTVIGVAAPRTR